MSFAEGEKGNGDAFVTAEDVHSTNLKPASGWI
jgi:hypothetical protein